MPLSGRKRSRSSNVAITKKKKTAVNPFEVRVNRKKHDVIGQKTKSDTGGRPGLSRSKAIEKRKKTLLKEYKERNKSNSFVDRRFGEYDEKMSVEEKMLQRFSFQKKHRLDKSAVYNLESEELTHHGKSIYDLDSDEEITKEADIDSEEDNTEEHFAGFLSKAPDRNIDDESQHPKSKKEAMAEVVTNSKLQKLQKQEDHLLIDNLVSKLDSDWKEIHSIVSKATSSKQEKSKADPYDIAFQELLLEGKSKTSKVSSEDIIDNDKTELNTDQQSPRPVQNLTRKEMDRAVTVFQARLKAEYKLFVKTKTWSHTQLTLFKMIRVLFSTSTSDMSIIHAAMFLLGKMLETKCPVDNCYDAMLGLLTCAEFIEFITPSSQFAPEVMNFLCAVLSASLLSVQESPGFYEKVAETEVLCVAHVEAERKFNNEGGALPCALCCVLDKITSSTSVTKSSLRVVLLKNCIILLTKVATLYHRLSSFAEIFTPLSKIIESCDCKKIPKDVKEEFTTLKNLICDHSKQSRKVLTMLKQTPKSIKFYEPKFDETYEVSKRKVRNKKVGESSKLKYKVKKETKGAIRELRKDNSFLARQQLTEQLERDTERKKRVQEIFSLLQTQQAEGKREKREKK